MHNYICICVHTEISDYRGPSQTEYADLDYMSWNTTIYWIETQCMYTEAHVSGKERNKWNCQLVVRDATVGGGRQPDLNPKPLSYWNKIDYFTIDSTPQSRAQSCRPIKAFHVIVFNFLKPAGYSLTSSHLDILTKQKALNNCRSIFTLTPWQTDKLTPSKRTLTPNSEFCSRSWHMDPPH